MQDFWNRSRPGSPNQDQLGEAHSQPGPAPPTPQPPATPDHKIMTEKLVNEIQVSVLQSFSYNFKYFQKFKCFVTCIIHILKSHISV